MDVSRNSYMFICNKHSTLQINCMIICYIIFLFAFAIGIFFLFVVLMMPFLYKVLTIWVKHSFSIIVNKMPTLLWLMCFPTYLWLVYENSCLLYNETWFKCSLESSEWYCIVYFDCCSLVFHYITNRYEKQIVSIAT